MRALALVVCLGSAACLGELTPYDNTQKNQSAVDGGAADLTGAAAAPDLNPNPGPGPSGGDMAQGLAMPDLKTCIDKTTAITDGHHNPGLDCMLCHNGQAAGAPVFTVGGTLYDALTGGNAVAGATVELTDAKGNVLRILSSTNGNFYSEQPVTYPVNARATACPADNHMTAQAATGACNSCHNATNQVHVP